MLLMSIGARDVQVTASLLQACYDAVVEPILGCLHIACSGLMITSLLQVVNRLDARQSFQEFLSTSFFQVIAENIKWHKI